MNSCKYSPNFDLPLTLRGESFLEPQESKELIMFSQPARGNDSRGFKASHDAMTRLR